jgi:integrase/recombinase XerD
MNNYQPQERHPQRSVAEPGQAQVSATSRHTPPTPGERVTPGQRNVTPHPADPRGTDNTRNARLAAIHSLFKYAAPRSPEHAAVISQVLAIPPRRRERAIVSYLTPQETQALLAAPDRQTWHGRRDHALLLLDAQTGLRVSEVTGLNRQDIHLRAGPHVRCHGKGRKDRATPLTTQTVKVMRTWLAELSPDPAGPLFPTQPGGRLSRDAV